MIRNISRLDMNTQKPLHRRNTLKYMLPFNGILSAILLTTFIVLLVTRDDFPTLVLVLTIFFPILSCWSTFNSLRRVYKQVDETLVYEYDFTPDSFFLEITGSNEHNVKGQVVYSSIKKVKEDKLNIYLHTFKKDTFIIRKDSFETGDLSQLKEILKSHNLLKG